ncbi:SDR family NAD(P)-dependent oxidoreductase [Acinetobacter baumannii]|uniref:SDR family NAD(P)-dependent oxidoreductase n=1 Tax=Acinetobacter baumannii TaxID=470 RepID=UPI001021E1BF|nr:SDR family NAD(P)-dependent oxidoreductase [Acinetobacter baumannii]RYL18458.1 SDR family NAD(P)-dependent oxidoreductase [Acinetobacter baumannii]RYL31342.1 SDR family NAD(P)-dependent oxidoreductase [Acinetobacter baumannii]RYL46020.1 SDR family NAD(P)-dependent oxidoreductase [Acinetobacter baumannii]
MLKTIFQKFQKKQGCVVVAGHDIELLDQNFVILDKNEQSPLYVYQAVHDSSVQNIQVNRVNDGITSVRLNLVNTEHIKSLLKYIASHSHSHSIELCVFQPNFSSAPNIEALSLEEIGHSWQTTGLSAVSVSQAVIKPMLKQQRGTVIFLGAPSNNSTHYDVLSQSMFASIRALSQSLAREFQPKGIHVTYCMVEKWDGQNQHFISSVKQVCQHIYQQPNTVWSQELSVS